MGSDDNKFFRSGKGFDNLQKTIRSKANLEVHVGFLRSAGRHKDSTMTVAQVAAANEFGTETIPERSFFRSTMAEQRKKLQKLLAKLAKQIIDGKTTEKKALTVVGMHLQTALRNKISSNIPPPNAPSTIRQKGSDKTLIDTGQMRDSVDFEVKKAGK